MKDLIKFNSLRGLFLVIVGIGGLGYYNQSSLSDYLDPSTASMPRAHLLLAENEYRRDKLEESYREIDLGIKSLYSIEDYSDSVANYYIELAIKELELIKDEIIKDSVNTEDMNHAFFETFNAMAYVNLRLSELRLEEDRKMKALEYFKNSFSNLKLSISYANHNDVKKEEKVIAEMRHILKEFKSEEDFEGFDYEQLNSEIEALME